MKYQETGIEDKLEEAGALFKALADPARLRILNLLAAKGWTCNCEIEAVTEYGNSKISRHLAYLKQVGLVHSRREGTWIFYALRKSEDPIVSNILQLIETLSNQIGLLKEDRSNYQNKICDVSPPINLG
jgi:ArsR family transcriptional regulator